jgi:hypothetical protein
MTQRKTSNANRQRAKRARAAMNDYADTGATDFPHQYAVRDLLSDLMHFCHQHKTLSFEAELDVARRHFNEEKTNRETETI